MEPNIEECWTNIVKISGIYCANIFNLKRKYFKYCANIATPKPSQTKSQNPKSQNPNPNPGLGGFIITLNRYRRRVLFEFSDFHYSYPNQILNLSF